MAAKKPSAERAREIAEINAAITQHQGLIAKGGSDSRLKAAQDEIRRLKQLKRFPGRFLRLADLLRNAQHFERSKSMSERFPKHNNTEAFQAAKSEKERLEAQYGSVQRALDLRDSQRRKATVESRGASDEKPAGQKGEPMKKLIASLAGHRDELGKWLTARDLWPELKGLIETEYRGKCEESTGKGGEAEYRYPFKGSTRKIGFKQFRLQIGAARPKR